MPEKLNYAGQMQPYDENNGEYKRFSSFHRPRNYDNEIKALKDKAMGLSIFSPERKKITEQIQQLEAEKEGFKNYDELAEYRHNQVLERNNKLTQQSNVVNATDNYIKDDHKEKQLEIINKFNPMRDDYHTGIRSVKDIKNPQEAFDVNDNENFTYPDFTAEDGKKALQTGKIMVYSSKPISQGGFISPSKTMAQDYAGGGEIYSQLVDINDVAWINSDEGQYAKVDQKSSYTDNYIKNNGWIKTLDKESQKATIDNFNKLPENQQFYYGLSDGEQASLMALQGDSTNVNEYMSGRNKNFDELTKKRLDNQIKNIKSAINKYDLKEPITLYRGVSKEEFDNIVDGGKTTSFKSTSTDLERAKAFGKNQGGYIVEYRVSKGSPVADVNGLPMANENEYLIDSDVKYKKVTKNGNKVIVEI